MKQTLTEKLPQGRRRKTPTAIALAFGYEKSEICHRLACSEQKKNRKKKRERERKKERKKNSLNSLFISEKQFIPENPFTNKAANSSLAKS